MYVYHAIPGIFVSLGLDDEKNEKGLRVVQWFFLRGRERAR